MRMKLASSNVNTDSTVGIWTLAGKDARTIRCISLNHFNAVGGTGHAWGDNIDSSAFENEQGLAYWYHKRRKDPNYQLCDPLLPEKRSTAPGQAFLNHIRFARFMNTCLGID